MQASAPAHAAPARQLLIFLCPQPACCCSEHAFSALRVQLPPDAAEGAGSLPEAARSPEELPSSTTQGFHQPAPQQGADELGKGASAADAAGVPDHAVATAAPVDTASSALDFSDVMGELNALADKIQASPAQPISSRSCKAPVGSPAATTISDSHTVQLPQQLPAFWIDARAEPAAPARQEDDDHVRQLLERYAESEEAAQAAGDDLQTPRAGRGGGEAYERDPAHERFRRRVSRMPGQCVRCAPGSCSAPGLCRNVISLGALPS